MDIMMWMQDWFQKHCDGDWEHEKGITISSLDNPGWSVEIYVVNTELENKQFTPVKIDKGQLDWLHCKVEDGFFKGYGGPKNLLQILDMFRQWTLQ